MEDYVSKQTKPVVNFAMITDENGHENKVSKDPHAQASQTSSANESCLLGGIHRSGPFSTGQAAHRMRRPIKPDLFRKRTNGIREPDNAMKCSLDVIVRDFPVSSHCVRGQSARVEEEVKAPLDGSSSVR